ncbi:MAG: hypothetical protein ABFR82_11820 [Nitrospirota bacterium]
MQKNITLLLCIFIIILMSAVAVCAEKNPDEKAEIHLSKKVRRLLSAEMNRIQNGMTNLVIAVSAGKWNEISLVSGKMEKGYIMRQKLTEEQREEFNSSLPEGYKKINNEFQEVLSHLIRAAVEHDGLLVNSYFSRLNKTCISCHSKYAKKRFPGFKSMKLGERN